MPAKRVSLTDIILPDIRSEMDELQADMREIVATQEAANAANGGVKRREITQVPEQVGTVYVADDTGLSASDVSSTLPRPTIALVTPDTVPVKEGEAKGALEVSTGCT